MYDLSGIYKTPCSVSVSALQGCKDPAAKICAVVKGKSITPTVTVNVNGGVGDINTATSLIHAKIGQYSTMVDNSQEYRLK